ncbi:hypothetical protein C3Y08_24110 [Burkholderia gladioli]|nr:hypothetical protein C3Y08_24110 [Burkholderia gladioli]
MSHSIIWFDARTVQRHTRHAYGFHAPTRGENRMNSLLDRIALLVTALALLLASWAVFRIGAEWVLPVLTLIALVALFAENARLRKKLREPGAEPWSRDKDPKA